MCGLVSISVGIAEQRRVETDGGGGRGHTEDTEEEQQQQRRQERGGGGTDSGQRQSPTQWARYERQKTAAIHRLEERKKGKGEKKNTRDDGGDAQGDGSRAGRCNGDGETWSLSSGRLSLRHGTPSAARTVLVIGGTHPPSLCHLVCMHVCFLPFLSDAWIGRRAQAQGPSPQPALGGQGLLQRCGPVSVCANDRRVR